MTPAAATAPAPGKSGTGMARTVSRLTGKPALGAGFLWGLAEGTFFFLVPDILITAGALFSFKASLKQIGAVLLGSLLAGSLLFTWGIKNPEGAKRAVGRVPFLAPAMLEKVKRDFDDYGVWAMCKGPMSGIPYKAYAVQAGPRFSWPAFLLVSVPARLERLLIVWALFTAVCVPLRSKVLARPGRALSLHAAYWIGIYAYYWSSV